MFEGQIIVDVLLMETDEITRASKKFEFPYQPYEGMKFDTGLGEYSIDSITWSLEFNHFHAWVYLVNSEHSIDYANEFEISGWEMNTFKPVEGYMENFLKTYKHPATEVIDCDACDGTGEGGIKQSMLGPTQSVCTRCRGLRQIIKAW
jgi:hypothetical protein